MYILSMSNKAEETFQLAELEISKKKKGTLSLDDAIARRGGKLRDGFLNNDRLSKRLWHIALNDDPSGEDYDINYQMKAMQLIMERTCGKPKTKKEVSVDIFQHFPSSNTNLISKYKKNEIAHDAIEVSPIEAISEPLTEPLTAVGRVEQPEDSMTIV